MNIFGDVYVYPEKGDNVNAVLSSMNSLFEDVFEKNNNHIVGKKLDITSESFEKIKKESTGASSHVLLSWMSDDTGMMGFTFYNFKTNAETKTAQEIGTDKAFMSDFLNFCGMKELIERDIR